MRTMPTDAIYKFASVIGNKHYSHSIVAGGLEDIS